MFYFYRIELGLININLKSSVTESLNYFIYILSILSAYFREDKDVVKVGGIVVIEGVI